jgi:hypothetical protein
MSEFRVEYEQGRTGKTFETFEAARASKRMEFVWSGRVGEIQERVGDNWVRTDDQRIYPAVEESA